LVQRRKILKIQIEDYSSITIKGSRLEFEE